MELSVIIVSYNVREYLREALCSVFRATQNIDHEIIVVDNCSSDSSCEMIMSEFNDVKLISQKENEGFATACNRGIINSAGDYILILNPDTIVENNALAVALDFMKQHPEAGAAGARMVNGEGIFLKESKRGFPSPSASLFRFTGLGKIFRRSSFFNAYYLGHLPDNQVCKADILTGAFMFIRREALDRAGLFDPDFFMYGEDIDLSWRIVRAGYVNYYLPGSQIIHFKGKSSPKDDPSRIRHFYKAMEIFASKHLKRRWMIPVSIGVKIMLGCSLTSIWLKNQFIKNSRINKKG